MFNYNPLVAELVYAGVLPFPENRFRSFAIDFYSYIASGGILNGAR